MNNAAVISHLSLQGDVSTVGPDLSSGLAVIPPLEHVVTRSQVERDQDSVHHTNTAPGRGLVAGAETRLVSLVAGWPEAGLGSVITRGAVAAWGAGTGYTG